MYGIRLAHLRNTQPTSLLQRQDQVTEFYLKRLQSNFLIKILIIEYFIYLKADASGMKNEIAKKSRIDPRIYLQMGEQVRTLHSEIHPAAKLQLTTQATKDWIHASRIDLSRNSDLPEGAPIIADGCSGIIQSHTCDGPSTCLLLSLCKPIHF